MGRQWTSGDVLQLMNAYQASCVLAAAADLDLFSIIGREELAGPEIAKRVGGNFRATQILLDALCAMEILDKRGERYLVPPTVLSALTNSGPGNVLAMVQHQANCLRRWSKLAEVIRAGRPLPREASVRGAAADYESFIEAMDNISGPIATKVVADLQPLHFKHLLDIGGGSGTWTIAFLRQNPSATATIFDLPQVMPQARQRLESAGLADRVKLVPGDYMVSPLPGGADLAWLGAIIHSLSREQNRMLYRKSADALAPGGRILIRDFVMDGSRTRPPGGAMFAVNMLSGTEGGGTWTLDEIREDLASAGFRDVRIIRDTPDMNAVVEAVRG